jgi:hypothetical protein
MGAMMVIPLHTTSSSLSLSCHVAFIKTFVSICILSNTQPQKELDITFYFVNRKQKNKFMNLKLASSLKLIKKKLTFDISDIG